MEEERPQGGRGPNKGQKGRPKGKGKSKSVGPPKGRGEKGLESGRTSGSRPPQGSSRNSGSRPPTSRQTIVEEEESHSRTSAHNTAFHDRRGRILPQSVAAAQARWKHKPDPLNVNQGRPDYRQKSFGTSREHQQHNSIFDASKKHFHMIRGKRVYVIHGAALTAHMDDHNKKEGPPNIVRFTYDNDYKLAYRGAFFYPFTFHMRIATPVEWIVQFARALVTFPDIDERLFIFEDSDKADLNKGRTAEKLVEVLGMSEPTAIAAACAITCASRELSRILRHDAPREDDNSVIVHEVVDRFHYGPVRAALAVKTSGTSRFRAYLRYKGETQGQWRKSPDLGQDARDIVELKLMAVGGWSDKLRLIHPVS